MKRAYCWFATAEQIGLCHHFVAFRIVTAIVEQRAIAKICLGEVFVGVVFFEEFNGLLKTVLRIVAAAQRSISIGQGDEDTAIENFSLRIVLPTELAELLGLQDQLFGFLGLVVLQHEVGQVQARQNALTFRSQLLGKVNCLAQVRFGSLGVTIFLIGQPKICSGL